MFLSNEKSRQPSEIFFSSNDWIPKKKKPKKKTQAACEKWHPKLLPSRCCLAILCSSSRKERETVSLARARGSTRVVVESDVSSNEDLETSRLSLLSSLSLSLARLLLFRSPFVGSAALSGELLLFFSSSLLSCRLVFSFFLLSSPLFLDQFSSCDVQYILCMKIYS